MSIYAKNTTVSSERTRNEIESTLRRYGATKFAYMSEETRALVAFEYKSRHVKMVLPLPSQMNEKYFKTPTGRTCKDTNAVYEKWEQDCRSAWRALALIVKAKLEAVESGVSTFDGEFLAYIVMPNGKTFGETALPQLEMMTEKGTMPKLTFGG